MVESSNRVQFVERMNIYNNQFVLIFPGIDRMVSYFPDSISWDFPPSFSCSGISQTTLFSI